MMRKEVKELLLLGSSFGHSFLPMSRWPLLPGNLPRDIRAVPISPELGMATRCHRLATFLASVDLPLFILRPSLLVPPCCGIRDP